MSTSISARQSAKIIDTLEEKGVTGELVQTDLLNGRLADLAEAMVAGILPPDRETFRKLLGLVAVAYQLIVDYTKSLATIIAEGKYDWVNENITEANFPNSASGTVSVIAEIVHFNRAISSHSAVAELAKMGLRPATIWELLAFGAKYPDIQRSFWIVALGSSCKVDGKYYVGKLLSLGSKRRANLDRCGAGWDTHYRFLAVRIK